MSLVGPALDDHDDEPSTITEDAADQDQCSRGLPGLGEVARRGCAQAEAQRDSLRLAALAAGSFPSLGSEAHNYLNTTLSRIIDLAPHR